MSAFECPYCEYDHEESIDVFELFDSQDETEFKCSSCRRTFSLYVEYDPIFTPQRIEEKLKDEKRRYENIYKNWPENTNHLNHIKKGIDRLEEIVRNNQAIEGASL